MSFALFLPGFAVEFGWAAGESVMVSHLISGLNLSLTMAGMIYVLNPCIGVLAQVITVQQLSVVRAWRWPR